MFFVASKLLWALLTPSNAAVLLLIAGALLLRSVPRAGRGLVAASSVFLLLAGFGPLGSWLLLPLEERFRPFGDDGAGISGIVVLGGAIEPDLSAARGELSLNGAAERMVALADLARRHPGVRVVFSGGSGALLPGSATEADAVHAHEADIGLPPGRVLYENRSRTTWENAVETAALVQPSQSERWLLVTSAFHMPRAVGCFRQAGFTVTAYPVDFRTRGPRDLWRLRDDVSGGLTRTDLAWREWLGLIAYRVSGRIASLFPSP